MRNAFAHYTYVNLEDPEMREFALSDPKGFIRQYNENVIIDEVQYAPLLFSYIQLAVDNSPKKGRFILTGSQNFLLLQRISQSLAGRVAIFSLLPLSLEELKATSYFNPDYEYFIFNGFYPRIYSDGLDASEWLSNYVRTYVERDVRNILNVGDIYKFQQFMKICAGRTGQLLNYSEMGNELGISYHTVNSWLSVLEASYIIFRLPPYFRNFNKRIVKSPKLYFYDTGLAAYLLGIRSLDEIQLHFARGVLFENLVISELFKFLTNTGQNAVLYFWRDASGNEVDCMIDHGGLLSAVEIKSGRTIVNEFFKGLDHIKKLSPDAKTFLVYGGTERQLRSSATVLPWTEAVDVF